MRTGTSPFGVAAAAAPPARPSRRNRRRTPRAVVRWRLIKLRFAREGTDPSREAGDTKGRNPDLRGVIGWLMRFRLTLTWVGLALLGALAAAWVAAPAGAASLNPPHAG